MGGVTLPRYRLKSMVAIIAVLVLGSMNVGLRAAVVNAIGCVASTPSATSDYRPVSPLDRMVRCGSSRSMRTVSGRIGAGGHITEYPLSQDVSPTSIAAGVDGALWFTHSDHIGRISVTGQSTSIPFRPPTTTHSRSLPVQAMRCGSQSRSADASGESQRRE